jgi:hypothetical protein
LLGFAIRIARSATSCLHGKSFPIVDNDCASHAVWNLHLCVVVRVIHTHSRTIGYEFVVESGTGVLASCPLKSVLGLGSKKAPARSPAAKKPAARRKPARKVAAKKPAKRKAAPKRRRAAR